MFWHFVVNPVRPNPQVIKKERRQKRKEERKKERKKEREKER